MKCPYAVSRTIQTMTTYCYNDNSQYEQVSTVERNSAQFVDCLQEECGAYQDGRCMYGKDV